jgi:predicted RecA/RadA family phage recombinase
MKNYVGVAHGGRLIAPYAVSAGQGLQVGQLFGVAESDSLISVAVSVAFEGVFTLTKAASQAWTVGALVYWDNTNRNVTTTATSNLLIGKAMVAVGSAAGETLGVVKLSNV